MAVTAQTIRELLAKRHSRDVWVPECKDGPTEARQHRRLDGWAMRRSWARLCTWGYEIKVSRGDFLEDAKWREYLPLCHMFSFVCPAGLISPEELPAEAGLIWASTTGTRLYTKKKAPHRGIEVPWELLAYILMSRAWIDGHCPEGESDHPTTDREFWEAWLEDRRVTKDLGWRVSRGLRKEINKRVLAAEQENAVLHQETERLQRAQAAIEELGLDLWDLRRHADKAVAQALAGGRLLHRLRHTKDDLESTIRALEERAGDAMEGGSDG